MHPSFYVNVIIYIIYIMYCQDPEAPQVSINRWVDKEDVVSIRVEYYSDVKKKKWNVAIYYDVDEPGGHCA